MKHHIVSIGISQHQNANANLDYAAKDATEFFELFGLNLPEQGYKKLLIDSEATLGQIQSAIGTELKEAVSKDDAFFFFYSGHGAVAASKEDINTASNYLVPFDATFDLENSCISVEYLKQVFESLPSKANFIFIDSCFSGCLTKNTKGYPVPKTKAFKSVKSFANTEIGNGTLIFTACKDDQESIEDPEYKNGLFTFELFSELQKKREGNAYDALTIFSPIAERVEVRAREKWNHIQTPTFSGKLQGTVSFPVFKKQLKVTPELLTVPRYTELTDAAFPIAQIEIPDKKKEQVINDILQLVVQSKKNNEFGEVSYERYCGKLLQNLKNRWEEIFIENGASIEELPNTVAKLEGASFQFMLLGGITAMFGSTTQMSTYSKYVVSILEWKQNKAGLVALISTPEIIVADIVYLIGILGLASEKLEPLRILMNTKFEDMRNQDIPPYELLKYNHIFFCEALSGYSNKVHDHIREVLNSFDWLSELVPRINGKVEDFQHQVNLLLSVWMMLKGDRMWPDFARFYAERVMPLVKKIKYDEQFQKKVGAVLGVKDTEVRQSFMECVEKYQKNGIGGNYFWMSISSDAFLTKEEREKEKIR